VRGTALNRIIRKLLALIVVCFSFVVPLASTDAGATTHTCGTNWCSGSDGATTTNVQGIADQIYLGEIGLYFSQPGMGTSGTGPCASTSGGNVPGADGSCFNGTAATNAAIRYTADTGMGVDFIWFGGGWGSEYAAAYSTPYCFGWAQGYEAEEDVVNYYGSYASNSDVMFMDIEQNNTFGWQEASSPNGQAAINNKDVFDGFSDFVAGRSSAQPSTCSSSHANVYQYGVYSAPDQWNYNFDASESCGASGGSEGTLTHTYIWTYETQEADSFPSSFTHACFFASSDYDVGYQFHISPDHDEFYEPMPLYVLGGNWGS
jgi:hypothetical protein